MSKRLKHYLLFVFVICFVMLITVCCLKVVRHVKHSIELKKSEEAATSPNIDYDADPMENIEERTVNIDGKEYKIYVND